MLHRIIHGLATGTLLAVGWLDTTPIGTWLFIVGALMFLSGVIMLVEEFTYGL